MEGLLDAIRVPCVGCGPALVDNVRILDFPNDTRPGQTIRGMGASRDMAKGDVIVSIPYDVMVTPGTILRWVPELESCLVEAEVYTAAPTRAILRSEAVIQAFVLLAVFGRNAHVQQRWPEAVSRMCGLLPTPSSLVNIDMWLLREYRECPVDYLKDDEALRRDRAGQQRLLSREEMTGCLGSAARFLKATRRLEKRYSTYRTWCTTVFAHSTWTSVLWRRGDEEGTRTDGVSRLQPSFYEWIWVESIVNSRSFTFSSTKTPWSDYPSKYLDKEEQSPADGNEETEEDGDDEDDEEGSEADESIATVLDRPEPTDVYALVPFADMFNHSPNNGHSDFDVVETTRSFVIRAKHSISAGSEVRIRYNNMSHWRYAKYYGFVPAPSSTTAASTIADGSGTNMADEFPIQVSLPPYCTSADPNATVLAVTKWELFADPNLRKKCNVTSTGANQQLRSVLRLRHLSEAELEKYALAYQPEPLSVRNEWCVFEALREKVTSALHEVRRHTTTDAPRRSPITEATQLALDVRERDLAVLVAAHKVVTTTFRELSEVMYYGTSLDSVLQHNPVHERWLRAIRSRQPTAAR